MIRRLVSTILIISLLPFPALRQGLSSGVERSPEFESLFDSSYLSISESDSTHEVPRFTLPFDSERPEEMQPICVAETEISEYEGSENAENGSIDLSCTFERRSCKVARYRAFEYEIGAGTSRFMNPNETFRTLRC